jgi:hypothetical protein
MEKYKAKTSLGDVILSVDMDKFITNIYPTYSGAGRPKGTLSRIENREYVIESGEEYIKKMYTGWPSYITKTDNGLFLRIELDDGYYGCPEYYLEKV